MDDVCLRVIASAGITTNDDDYVIHAKIDSIRRDSAEGVHCKYRARSYNLQPKECHSSDCFSGFWRRVVTTESVFRSTRVVKFTIMWIEKEHLTRSSEVIRGIHVMKQLAIDDWITGSTKPTKEEVALVSKRLFDRVKLDPLALDLIDPIREELSILNRPRHRGPLLVAN